MKIFDLLVYLRSVDTGRWWRCSGGPLLGPSTEEGDVDSKNLHTPHDVKWSRPGQPFLTGCEDHVHVGH